MLIREIDGIIVRKEKNSYLVIGKNQIKTFYKLRDAIDCQIEMLINDKKRKDKTKEVASGFDK